MGDSQFIVEFATCPLGRIFAALWGALWGSFFNVVIARVPEEESLLRPGSHCRSCGAPVRWHDNIPVLSYLLLRGRCRHCRAKISPRYLVVEVLVAAAALGVHEVFVVAGPHPIGLRLAQFVIGSLFCGLLVAVAFIDLDTMLIPNVITYPGIPVAAALSIFMGHPHLWDGPVGAVGGYLLVRGLADGYRLIRRRQGMGYGDAKLLALIAGLLGWQRLVPVLFLASVQGTLIGVTALMWARRRRRRNQQGQGEPQGQPTSDQPALPEGTETASSDGPLRFAMIPFGPFLSLAGIEVLLLHTWLSTFFPVFEWP
jgi:leader peptidase (prepilin peptidase) / N-methyltransferase